MKKLFAIALFTLFCANVLRSQTPNWSVASLPMKYPVTGGQAVYDLSAGGTKIYVLGGYSDSLQQTVDWIQEYDVEANSWKIVGRMLQARRQFVAGIWNGNVVYFGGAHDTSKAKTTLEIWNINTKSVPSVYDVNSDFGRSFATGYVIGDNVYMFGGSPSAGGKISYIASYSLSSKKISWTFDFASEEKPREQMTFLVNNNIYVFGGAYNGVIDRIQKYVVPPQKGENLTVKLLEKRAGGAAVYSSIHKKGFLIAGYNEANQALRTVEEIIVFSDGSINITKMPSLKYARNNPMAVDYKGIIAVFGGRDSIGKVVPFVELLQNVVTDINEKNIPSDFKLSQNYPNPFNPSTVISYQLSKPSFVSLKIFDALGNEIETLISQYLQAGNYEASFSTFHTKFSSGVYFARLESNGIVKTIKMMLLK